MKEVDLFDAIDEAEAGKPKREPSGFDPEPMLGRDEPGFDINPPKSSRIQVVIVVGGVVVLVVLAGIFYFTSYGYKGGSVESSGDDHAEAGRLAEAIADYKSAREIFDQQVEGGFDTDRIDAKLCKVDLQHAEASTKANSHTEAVEAYRDAGERCEGPEARGLLMAMVTSLVAHGDQKSGEKDWKIAIDSYGEAIRRAKDGSLDGFDRTAVLAKRAEGRRQYARWLASRKEWRAAGDAFMVSNEPDKAIEAYKKGELWGQLAYVLAQEGRWAEAGELYVKAGNWKWAADNFINADEHGRAADCFMKLGDERRAAGLYRQAGLFAKVGEAYAALSKKDKGVESRLEAARAFKLAEDTVRADAFFKEALEIATRHGDFYTLMAIHHETDGVNTGLDAVTAEFDRLMKDNEAYEARDLLSLALGFLKDEEDAMDKISPDNRLKLLNNFKELDTALEKYPDVVDIKGVNHSLRYDDSYEVFKETTITGSIKNITAAPISSVSIRVRLFRKDFGSFTRGADDWSSVSDEIKARFSNAEAGHTELIEIRDLQPGESRKFRQVLGNEVPYKSFDHSLSKLVLGTP